MREFVIHKEGLRFDLRPVLAFLSGSRDGDYRVSIVRIGKKRTDPQNRYLWGVVYPLLLNGLNALGWDFTTDEQFHEYCKARFCPDPVMNYTTGEVVNLPSSTAKMTVEEFQAYIQKLGQFAQEDLGFVLPDPLPF